MYNGREAAVGDVCVFLFFLFPFLSFHSMAFFQNIHSSFQFICVCGCATATVVVSLIVTIGDALRIHLYGITSTANYYDGDNINCVYTT